MIIDNAFVMADVTAASDRYEAALLSNDLAVLDELFWQDERVERISPQDELVGIEAIRRFRAARPVSSLARERLRRSVVCFGDDCAVVNILFRRLSDACIGRQSQTWARIGGAWRIVSAHISYRSA